MVGDQIKEDKLLKTGDVAILFNVAPDTVTRWAREGKLPVIKTPGGQARFRESTMRQILEEESGEDSE